MKFHRNYPQEDGNSHLLSLPQRLADDGTYTGKGVVIAFIDSGFYPHPDLAGRIDLYVDASVKEIQLNTPFDEPLPMSWHGQMTSVIAAGSGSLSDGCYRGVAPSAHVILIKVSTPKHQIKEADILRGLNWVIEHGAEYHIRVVNVSVGGDFPDNDPRHPLHVAVSTLVAQGVTVVVASGNSGRDVVLPPASSASVITVGAYNDQNSHDPTLWQTYPNNFGLGEGDVTKPDIYVTGRFIPSPILPSSLVDQRAKFLIRLLDEDLDTLHLQEILKVGRVVLKLTPLQSIRPSLKVLKKLQGWIDEYKLVDAHYQHVDGTSVSTAIVSGVCAQLLEANPSLTPVEIKDILIQTASSAPTTLEQAQPNNKLINLPNALAEATRRITRHPL